MYGLIGATPIAVSPESNILAIDASAIYKDNKGKIGFGVKNATQKNGEITFNFYKNNYVFVAWKDARTAIVYYLGKKGVDPYLAEVDITTGQEKKLTNLTALPGELDEPLPQALSPLARWIILTKKGKARDITELDVNDVSQQRTQRLILLKTGGQEKFELPVSFFPDVTIGWSFQGDFAAISTRNYEWVEGKKKQRSEIYLLNTKTKKLTQVSHGVSLTSAPPTPSENGQYVAAVEQESKSKSVVILASSGNEVIRVSQGVAAERIDDSHMVALVAHRGEYELTLVDIKAKNVLSPYKWSRKDFVVR